MYNVIIVDDEEIIRSGMKQLIENVDERINVVATLCDGSEAISFILNNEVDIVVTDIKMSRVSGLELVKFLYSERPDIKVVILSGYREFEYAKTAMKYGVKYYLLKPTNFSEIIDVFQKLLVIIDEERQKNANYHSFSKMYLKNIFTGVVYGVISQKKEVFSQLNELKGTIDSRFLDYPCGVICVTIQNLEQYLSTIWKHGKERFYIALTNFLEDEKEINDVIIIAISTENKTLRLLVFSRVKITLLEFSEKLKEYIKVIGEAAEKILSCQLSFIIENILENPVCLMEYFDNKINQDTISFDFEEENKKLFYQNIMLGDKEIAENILFGFVKARGKEDIEKMKNLSLTFFQFAVTHLNELTEQQKLYQIFQTINKKIQNFSEKEKLFQYLSDTVKLLCILANNNRKITNSIMVEKAKTFIENHYNEDISLEDVANHVYLNRVYFSKFFKQNTGENFIDYLISLRMEKAIALLNDKNYKIQDISVKVGYENSKYFTKLFKKYTGYTPRDYKSVIIGMSDIDDK